MNEQQVKKELKKCIDKLSLIDQFRLKIFAEGLLSAKTVQQQKKVIY